MTTKFILVGGFPKVAADGGKAFCDELIKGFSTPVTILDCLFARAPKTWEKVFSEDKEFFAKHLPGVQIDLQQATVENFIDQVGGGRCGVSQRW